MVRCGLAGLLLVASMGIASAQTWAPWYQPSLLDRAPPRREAGPSRKSGPALLTPGPRLASTAPLAPPDPFIVKKGPPILDGGARPSIAAASPPSVALKTSYGSGTVVIDTSARRLYLVQSGSSALAYPISVGRDGFRWTGTESISRVANWPDWRPPAEMRLRQPELPEVMTGGIRNPLGAKALYLGNSLYRIHGTNSAQSVGRANSSGCFRMTNNHVVDLASRVGVGTTVIVKSKL